MTRRGRRVAPTDSFIAPRILSLPTGDASRSAPRLPQRILDRRIPAAPRGAIGLDRVSDVKSRSPPAAALSSGALIQSNNLGHHGCRFEKAGPGVMRAGTVTLVCLIEAGQTSAQAHARLRCAADAKTLTETPFESTSDRVL